VQLKQALTDAQLGDNIILDAGTTYQGQFTLPNKTTGSGWITIESSKVAQLPAGERVGPKDAVNMPRLEAPGNNASVLRTPPGNDQVTPVVPGSPSHHYKLIGIEFVGPANNSDVTALIELGTPSAAQTQISSVPHDIVIDRCYMHPNTRNAQIRRAIALNSASTDITNCYIEEIHQAGSDSQAIGGSNGPGPFNIINNHLEAASENILFGGDTTRLAGYVPSDIVIRNNHLFKPYDWRDGTNGAKAWSVKNLFELKQGRRVTVENNVMENCWEGGQSGVAIVLKLGNYGTSPQNVTEDVVIRNNIIRHANGAIALQGRDYAENSPGGLVRRLTFTNNLFDDINGFWSNARSGNGTFNIYVTQGPKDVLIDHNTFLNAYTTIETDSSNATYPATNFRFTNNITAHSLYGVRSTSGTGNPTFTMYYNEGTLAQAQARFTNNALMGGPNGYKYDTRPNTWFPASWSAVGFVDKAGGNFRLTSTSPFHAGNANDATDNTDLGANIDTLEAATATAINGTSGIGGGSAPTITASSFGLDSGRPFLAVTFSEAIGSSLGLGDVSFTNLDSPGGAKPTVQFIEWEAATNTARFYLNVPISDGNFRASYAGIKDSANNALIGSASQDFFFLLGDANQDRAVNALDFNLLAAHYGVMTPVGYTTGDFDFSGKVNSTDFTILATNFGHRLAGPAPVAPLGALAASPASKNLFSASAIQTPDVLL
jgi:hypothetical protein